MRSKISFFNGTIFKKNISRYWPIWVVFLVYLICQVPVGIFVNTAVSDASLSAELLQQEKMDAYFMVLENALSSGICFVVAVLSAMAVFHYMYYQRNAHAYHSFPVRREELFFTNYFSGLLFFSIPLLLAFLMGSCVCALKGITALEYLLIWFLLMEGMCFFFYNMTILVGMFTGQFFAVPLLTLILNYLYVGCRYVVLSIVGMISYGMSDIYEGRLVSFLSPLYFLSGKVGFETKWQGQESVYLVNGCQYVAIYAALGLLCGLIAFLMYRKRKMEWIGDMLVIGMLKPLFRWIFAGMVSMLFAAVVFAAASIPDAHLKFLVVLFLVLIMGVVCFFAAEMLLQRKVHVFKKKRWLECAVYSGVMALFLVCVECNVFGLENSMPQADEIENVQMYVYYPLYAEEEDDIEKIMAIHQRIIDSKDEFEGYYTAGKEKNDEAVYASIRYTLTDGTPFIRNYMIPADEAYRNNPESVVTEIRDLSCDLDLYLKGNLCLNYEEARMKRLYLDVYNEGLESTMLEVEKSDWDKLVEAIVLDIQEGNMLINSEDIYEEDDDFYYWNLINVELYAENGLHNYWEDEYDWGEFSQQATYSFSFNKGCRHILAALEELGLLDDSEHLLITNKEYYRMQEELYGE